MERQQTIIREDIFVVDHSELNSYGDLIVTDVGGNEYKIGVKRKHLFPVFGDNISVRVGFASYNNREYIAEARKLEVEIPEETPPETSKPKPSPKPEAPEIAPQERGMCLKEVGEGIRTGQLEKDFPKGFVKIKADYYKKISRGSGIDFWIIEP